MKEDPERKLMTMRHVALYVILSPHDNEQSDLIHRVLKEKVLEDLPVYKRLLQLFTTPELINQANLCQMYEKDLRTNPPTGVFDSSPEGEKR